LTQLLQRGGDVARTRATIRHAPPNSENQVERLMGPAFERLAPALQNFHRITDPVLLHGKVRTEAPAGLLARLMGRLLGTPLLTSQGPLLFGLDTDTETTRWIRDFPHEQMRSTLRNVGTHLEEHLGPVRLRFALEERDSALHLHLKRMTFLRVPCPRILLPRVIAVETGRGSQLHFHIQASLPFGGLVTRYAGYLEIPDDAPLK
jgi:hypothetical protein